ncbi:MAG: threonine synthase [Planctomycetota bacterium]|nr:MAG: threonine synthase [Planctomycetota bacterium]
MAYLECGRCGQRHASQRLHNVCTACGGPLLCRYDLDTPGLPALEEVLRRPAGQFRLHELLPTESGAQTPSLGEGATPLLPGAGLGAALGLPGLLVKDEAQNPTSSFKARGMAVAMARARELGAVAVCLPSAGNAGCAAAAYGARHGLEVHVAVPQATPRAIVRACRALGAGVTEVPGSIADAGKWMAEQAAQHGWFSLATLREPYRVEGKKVMAYELVYELGRVPDVVVYPTGGGTGLIGMAKAFDEMQSMGWIGAERPRFVSVQMAGCAPIVRAFESGAETALAWDAPAETAAYGLRVPAALGDFLMLRALRGSGGSAVAVSEEEMQAGCERMARRLGLWPAPEGGACVAAAAKLRARGWLGAGECVVLFNTGSPFPYCA